MIRNWKAKSLPSLAVAALFALHLDVALSGSVQKQSLVLPNSATSQRNQVVQMFTETYETYRKFAFGHDDLRPVSLTFNDGRNGWGASIVDAMSTMAIMGLDDFFNEAVNFSSQIDFSRSRVPSETVSVFETTIRYLGGLLSAFQLSGEKHDVLLQKAKQVADKLAFAWVGSNDVPFGQLNFANNKPLIQSTNIAEAGTLTLEFATLSKLTGNDTYRQLVEKSVKHIAGLPDPLPGLAAQGIDPVTGQFTSAYVTWGGGSDSYFEYLIKYPRLTLTSDPIFTNTWRTAVDSSIKFLAKTSTVGGHQYLSDFNNQRKTVHVGSHLACFHGGNWLLGGKLLNNQTIVDFALKLVDACWNTYQSTETGIGPEGFGFISDDGGFTGRPGPSPSDMEFYNKHGFYSLGGSSYYILRPEVLESNFYAWRVTGDTKYLDRAAAAVASFDKVLKVNNAFAGIGDVNNPVGGGGFIDDTESFFFAEVLKYLYLTFDDPNHISLDEFVFNTEAHPFKAPSLPENFGDGTGIQSAQKGEFSMVTPTYGDPHSAVSGLPVADQQPFEDKKWL